MKARWLTTRLALLVPLVPLVLTVLLGLPGEGWAQTVTTTESFGSGSLPQLMDEALPDATIIFSSSLQPGVIEFRNVVAEPSRIDLPIDVSADLTVNGVGLTDVEVTSRTEFLRIRSGTTKFINVPFADGGEDEEPALSGSIDVNSGATLEFEQTERLSGVYTGDLTGSGEVVKSGSGDFTLSGGGGSGFTGTLSVNEGRLIGGTESLLGDIIIAEGATLEFGVLQSGNYAGALSGDGNLVISEDADLSGATFGNAGTTTISGGTLTVDPGNFSVAPVIESAGTLQLETTADDTYDLTGVEGTGTINKAGTGSLVFDGEAPEFTGSFGVLGGTATGASDSFPGTGAVSVSSGATLNFDQVMDDSFARAISGEGTVTKAGLAVLTLTGDVTATSIQVDAGTLDLESSTVQSEIAIGAGVLRVGSDANQQITGVISDASETDSGALTKKGAGTTTLIGVNTYSGPTTITEGTLRGDGDAIQGDIDLASASAALELTGGTFGDGENDSIEGTGNVIFSGSVVLEGAQAYVGDTTISGSLELGSGANISGATGTTTISGTLSGAGTIANPVRVQGGTLSPGSGTGTANPTIAKLELGPTTLDSDAEIVLQVSASSTGADAFDQVLVTGDLDGPVAGAAMPIMRVSVEGELPGPDDPMLELTVVEASGNTSIPSGIEVPEISFFINASAEAIASTGIVLTLGDNGRTMESFGRTQNEKAVGRALDTASGTATGDMADVITLVRTSPTGDEQLLDSMSGEIIGAFGNTRLSDGLRYRRAIARRVRIFDESPERNGWWGIKKAKPSWSTPLRFAPSPSQQDSVQHYNDADQSRFRLSLQGGPDASLGFGPPPGEKGWGGWVQGYGIFGDQDGDGNSSSYDYRIYGAAGGIDYRLADMFLVGVSAGYTHTEIDFGRANNEGNANTARAGLYAAYGHPWFYLSAQLDYGYDWMETIRRINFNTLARRAEGNFQGSQVSGYFEAGLRPISFYGFRYQHYLSYSWNYVSREAFSESGANSINLAVAGNSANTQYASTGMRLDYVFDVQHDFKIRPEIRGRYYHQFGDRLLPVNATFQGATRGGAFGVLAAAPERDSGLVGAGVEFIDRERVSTILNYDAHISDNNIEHIVSLGFLVRW